MLIAGNPLADHRGSEIHNGILHDESTALVDYRSCLESDHAPFAASVFICPNR